MTPLVRLSHIRIHLSTPVPKPPSTLHPRDDDNPQQVPLQLATSKSNIHSDTNNILYNRMYNALTSACPYTSTHDSTCVGATTSLKIHVPHLFHSGEWHEGREALAIVIRRAHWYANEKMYYLLIGAIAGAARGPRSMPTTSNGPMTEPRRTATRLTRRT
jgi:hypothetical protein